VTRDLAIDYLRSSVTVLVVAHHAALAYTTYGSYDPGNYIRSSAPIIDSVRSLPLTWFVGWNDMFFMALMFFISGLFVKPSLERKGVGHFLSDRAKRLGIPFVFAVIVLSPLAYYPSWLLSDSAAQGSFLRPFFVQNWSSGPAWFIWVLLAFSGIVALADKWKPEIIKKLSWSPSSVWNLLAVFFVVSLVTTIPVRLFIPAPEWVELPGPLSVQTWRILLYFSWFLMGVALGGADPARSLACENLRLWPLWLILGFLIYMFHGLLELKDAFPADTPFWKVNAIMASVYSLCCAVTGLGALGLARSCFQKAVSFADSFTDCAYGVYIFHYCFVTWTHYFLLALPLSAVLKFLITFVVALMGSWLLTAVLRRTAARKVL